MSKQGKIEFTLTDTQEKVEFYIIEQTRINNCNYILVADSMEDEAQALILKRHLRGKPRRNRFMKSLRMTMSWMQFPEFLQKCLMI